MHPRTAAGKHCGRIRQNNAIPRDDPKQIGFVGADTAAKAGSYVFHPTPIRGSGSMLAATRRP